MDPDPGASKESKTYGSETLVPRLEPTYLSEMSVVYVGYDVEKQPVDLLDDLIEVWREVVAVL
jgi:hypothetical protein